METYWNILIFIIILFLYMHIIDQYKKSEDLEIYEMDYVCNTNLQEICNIKQPLLFEFKSINPDIFADLDIRTLEKHENQDVKVKDTDDASDYVMLKYGSFKGLMDSDVKSHFITEGNHEFIEDAGLYSDFAELNMHFRPAFTVQTKYDIMMGSKEASTPLRYHTNERFFLVVSSGKIHVKMTPWKSRKYLHLIMDYDNYEFRSPIHAWDNTKNSQYMNDVDKLKYLEFDVLAGYTLYIPPYWWYSIKYSSEPDTLVLAAIYNSAMNIMANTPDIIRYFIQQQNTVTKVARTLISSQDDEKPNESL
jgi:hypothetical protein